MPEQPSPVTSEASAQTGSTGCAVNTINQPTAPKLHGFSIFQPNNRRTPMISHAKIEQHALFETHQRAKNRLGTKDV